MENKTFNLGDIVKLKSGGPLMTVVDFDYGDHDARICGYFDNKDYKKVNINIAALQLAE